MLNNGATPMEASKPSSFDFRGGFDKGGLFDLGHPLLNRIADSFVKAAGIGAIQAVSREAYFTATEGSAITSIFLFPFSFLLIVTLCLS